MSSKRLSERTSDSSESSEIIAYFSAESAVDTPSMNPVTPRGCVDGSTQGSTQRDGVDNNDNPEQLALPLAGLSTPVEFIPVARPSSSARNIPVAGSSSSDVDLSKGERKILELGFEILLETQENRKAVLGLLDKEKRKDEPITASLKLKSAEELEKFEEKIQKNNFAFEEFFKQYCPEIKNPAHSGLAWIMSDDLMDTLNLRGVKGRRKFSGTILYNTLWKAWGPLGAGLFQKKEDYDASIMYQIKASRNRRYVKKSRDKAQKN